MTGKQGPERAPEEPEVGDSRRARSDSTKAPSTCALLRFIAGILTQMVCIWRDGDADDGVISGVASVGLALPLGTLLAAWCSGVPGSLTAPVETAGASIGRRGRQQCCRLKALRLAGKFTTTDKLPFAACDLTTS